MTPFTERSLNIIRRIPSGKVTTYGQIALLAGNPKAARQIARILHSMSEKYGLPWHRVLNAKGMIAFSAPDAFIVQKRLLEDEGVEVDAEGRVNLELFFWHE